MTLSDRIAIEAGIYARKNQGSRPMSITWKLDVPIPAKYLRKTNKLVVG